MYENCRPERRLKSCVITVFAMLLPEGGWAQRVSIHLSIYLSIYLYICLYMYENCRPERRLKSCVITVFAMLLRGVGEQRVRC